MSKNPDWLPDNWKTVLPDWVPEEAWNAWMEKRILKKKPMSLRGRKMAFKKLWGCKMQGYDIETMIDRSEDDGWTGLYPRGEPKQTHLRAAPEVLAVVDDLIQDHILKPPDANKQAIADKVREEARAELRKITRSE